MADEELTVEKILEEVEKVHDWNTNRTYESSDACKACLSLLKKAKPDDSDQWLKFVLLSLSGGCSKPCEQAAVVLQKKKLFDWKDDNASPAGRLLEVFSADTQHAVEDEDDVPRSRYTDVFTALISQLKLTKTLDGHMSQFFEMMKGVFSAQMTKGCNLAYEIAEIYPWKTRPDDAVELLGLLKDWVQEYGDDTNSSAEMYWPIQNTLRQMCIQTRGSATVDAMAPVMLELLNHCKDSEMEDIETQNKLVHHEIVKTILGDYFNSNCERKEAMQQFVEAVKDIKENGADEELQTYANNAIQCATGKLSLGEDLINELIDSFIQDKDMSHIHSIQSMYDSEKDVIHARFGELMDTFSEDMDEYTLMGLLGLLNSVIQKNPDLLDDKCGAILCKSVAKGGNGSYQACIPLQFSADLKPEILLPYDDMLVSKMGTDAMMAGSLSTAFTHLSKADPTRAPKYMKSLVDNVDKFPEMYQISIVYSMYTIGCMQPELLKRHQALIERLKEEPQLSAYCEQCLDVIAGRSLKKVQEQVVDQGEEISELDNRVTETEERTDTLEQRADDTDTRLTQAEDDIVAVETRVDAVEEVVEETVEKVEELDHKTLSHAPVWSRDVAKLMNPEASNDWKLLASRLAYTNDDIRNWATQPDPCLSLLDEWFATHKTREGTYAVMKMLVEINRVDAAEIVEQALKEVADIIEDEEEEAEDPPEVFISYQWSHQPEVKLLKKHLEMAGFQSWMDIGQMGGGDKLYSKIDSGIRSAKIIICCVTTKYAQSPNCNKEVNLAVTLGKPIIPLLMENLQWPPPGSMGPIFGEYLYIRFFQRNNEIEPGKPYWNEAKMQELLMQIRYYVVPNPDIIEEDYKNWWNPEEEEIVIKARDNSNSQSAETKETTEEEALAPDVFISYQWGKQRQVSALYKRLIQMGYTCWMDIKMMGGGDSLYDKIDRGIRGCKVVLSCVTTKYSLSANCRREVSLSDALKRPIIPLLLEDITWPPEGPMAMVFTQLLYINFCKPHIDIQDKWLCPQFDELIRQMKLHVPDQDAVLEAMTYPNHTKPDSNKSHASIPRPASSHKPMSHSVQCELTPRTPAKPQLPKQPQRPASSKTTSSSCSIL